MEESIDYIIVQVISGFLGSPKNSYAPSSNTQWQFNCVSPTCRNDGDKYNLEYNSSKHVFKCWKCGYRGYVHKLVGDYGTNSDLSHVKSMLPESLLKGLSDTKSKPTVDHHLITCELPVGYLPLSKKRDTALYRLAWNYLVDERKVSLGIIDKYNIGYTETGPRKFRIIIPSKNMMGRYNYYEARSYMKGPKVIPYIKPSSDEVHKNDIIFNENFINWDLPIFLVEGVFDMFRIPNSIPVLGKEISELLIRELVKHKSVVIICFDPDAIDMTVKAYLKLESLGLSVFYVDLSPLNLDISMIYEEKGRRGISDALKNIKKLDLSMQIKKNLKDN